MTQEDYFAQGMLPPEMGLEVADGIMQNLNPQLRPEVDGLTSDISGQLADITDEELAQIIQLVQQLYDEPDNYAQNRAALIQSGELTEEDLPPQYDPEALAMMLYVLRKEQQARSGGMSMQPPSSMPPMAGAAPPEMQPPQGFARGGIAEAARLVANSGRFGDTMLAHINPREARLLRKHGGSGTINPKTGLPEFIFKFLKKAWNAVWKPVAKFLNTKVGKIVSNIALNILIPGYGSIIAAGLQTAAAGGNFGDIVKNMAISGATQYLSGGLADKGMPSPIQGPLDAIANTLNIKSEVGRMALNQGLVTTGMGLVQGQSLKDAATSGVTAAATIQAADFAKKLLTPQGQYNDAKGKVEGNRLINKDSNAMQDAVGPSVGGRAQIEDRFVGTGQSDYANYLKDPNAAGATITPSSAAVSPPVNVTSTSGATPVANAGTSTANLYKPVSVKDAFSTMGEGTKQMFTGDVSGGFNKLTQGAGDLFMPSGPTDQQVLDLKKSYQAQDPTLSSDAALKMAQSQGPGLVRTYGPAAAAGLGIMAMAGGFDTPGQGGNPNGPQFRGPTGEDLLKQNPNKYLVQGLPGVQYDAQGNIIGNKEQYPYYRMPDIQVASNYGGAPRFAKGGHVAYAQANNDGATNPNARSGFFGIALTDMVKQAMSNKGNRLGIDALLRKQQEEEEEKEKYRLAMKKPQQYAYGGSVPGMTARSGGIAGLAAGGYPRKTGQISGPGTETSDSIPAMLSDGEFVMTARAVRGLGKGSRREGAKKMYALMHQLERNAARG